MNKNLQVVFFDIKYSLKAYWSYKFAFFSDLCIFTILFSGILFARFDGLNVDTYVRNGVNEAGLFFMAYLMWQYTSVALSSAGNLVRNECMAGTIQHKLMSEVPLSVLFFSNFITTVATQSLVVVVLTLVAHYILGVDLLFSLIYVPVVLITLVGMLGIGLIVGGLTLKTKRTGGLVNIIQILLLMGGNVMNRTSLHPILQWVPLYKGIQIMQIHAMKKVIATSDLLYLLLSAFLFLIMGNWIIKISVEKMKEAYTIYHY